MAAVQQRARWYVSVGYTVAENLRVRSGRELTWPAAESADVSGSPTPIDAVTKLLRAVADHNLSDLIALLDPNEAAVLQRVAPWFTLGAEQAIDDYVRREGIRLQISEPQYKATTKGTRSVVTFSGLQVVLKTNERSIAFRDNCAIFTSYGQADTRQCVSDAKGARESLAQQLVRLGLSPTAIHGVLVYDDLRSALEQVGGVGVVEIGRAHV